MCFQGALCVVSDLYPLFGYHKRSYIICAAVMGCTAWLGLAALNLTPVTTAILLFTATLQITASDLLCEGKYASVMKEKPESGSSMVSFVWGCYQLGALLAACIVGPVADRYDPKVGCAP